jgi:hypothetical protein
MGLGKWPLATKETRTANALSGAASIFSERVNYSVRNSLVLAFICYVQNKKCESAREYSRALMKLKYLYKQREHRKGFK